MLKSDLDLNVVCNFMKEFKADFINRFSELIIDHKNNIYLPLDFCKSLEDLEAYTILVMCRPIGKGLEKKEANRLLKKVNEYFKSNLTRDDMHEIYGELGYKSKIPDIKEFIKNGFPMEEIKGDNEL